MIQGSITIDNSDLVRAAHAKAGQGGRLLGKGQK